MINLRQATGGIKKKKKVRSNNLLDRIEECDKTGQYLLDIAHLDLAEWPKEIIIVPAIHILHAHRNNFTTVPSLGIFRALEVLDLSRCNLTSIDAIGFAAFNSLYKLNLSRNNLTALPADIVTLLNLDTLLVDRNQLLSFPRDMHALRALRVLDASHNLLTDVASSLDAVPLLDDLNLAHNAGLSVATLGTRTRRLVDKRALMASKAERRALISRALSVQRAVLTREQQAVFREVYVGGGGGGDAEINELP